MIQHDVVIIGSGIAGMRCALEIKRQMPSANVAIVTKQYPTRAPSVMDRNGIAAVLHNQDQDRIELHANDTVIYGGGANNRDAVQILCENAPSAVYELEHMGLVFNRTRSGHLAQRKGYGHARARLAYSGDQTGHAIVHTLYGELVRFGIKIYPEFYMISLAVDGRSVRGVAMMDMRTSEVHVVNAKATVLATGSYGRIFATTSDANSSTGDGHAAALRAGVKLSNMDRVMFHPLGLAVNGLVLSEHLLHDGATLLNGKEQRFTDERGALSQICRDIEAEIVKGNGAGAKKDHVWLDLRDMPAQHIREFHPSVIEYARNYYGIDVFRDMIPVKPTVAATLGGIPTDINGQVTGFEGLFAVGACADNGIHGERALSGNDLASAVVFGKRTGGFIVSWLGQAAHDYKPVPDYVLSSASDEVNMLLNQKGDGKLADLRQALWGSVSKNNGLTQDVDLVQQHVGMMRETRNRFDNVALQDKSRRFNLELVDALELDRMVDVAGEVAKARIGSVAPPVRTASATTHVQPQAVMAETPNQIPAATGFGEIAPDAPPTAVTASHPESYVTPPLPHPPATVHDTTVPVVAPAEPLPPIAKPAPVEPLPPIAKPAPAEPLPPIMADTNAPSLSEPVRAATVDALGAAATTHYELKAGPYANSVMALPDNSQPEGYLIKGNQQSMLYHVPGSRYYKVTKAEMWFKTEEDAIKAGFKKPGQH